MRWVSKGDWKWLTGIVVSVGIVFYSVPPHSLGWLSFIGLVPVFFALETAPTWQAAAFRAWLFGFLCNALVCTWIAHAIHVFTELSWVASYPGVVLLSFFEQGAWLVVAALRHLLHRKWGVRPVLWTPIALMVVDACWPKYFPNTMGIVFYRIPWLCQLADIVGVWGLTALLVATNECAAILIFAAYSRGKGVCRWSRKELFRHSIATLAFLGLSCGYGAWRFSQIRQIMAHPIDRIRVAIVQPNLNGAMQVRAASDKKTARAQLLEHMLLLTDRAIALKPDFVFWPETSYPDTYHSDQVGENREVTARLDHYLLNKRVPLLMGARDQKANRRYNALFLVVPRPDGAAMSAQAYYKTQLLEFSEHIPFSEEFPQLGDLARRLGSASLSRGPGASSFTLGKWRLGPMICLEGLYPRFVRDVAERDAQILVNATNDAWFGDSREPALHLYLTAFRSIETRRPLVRATNTGHSAIIDIDGSMRIKTDLLTERVFADDVPIYPDIGSPFLVMGDRLLLLAGLVALLPFIRLLRRRR